MFKIPPLKANEGHRATEWGDLAKPLWSGRLRIIEKSDGAALHFEDAQTGEYSGSRRIHPQQLIPVQENVYLSSGMSRDLH